MVLYTVLNMMGQRDGKDLGPQDTVALIRSLKLGAGAKTKVILVGKDGEKKTSRDESECGRSEEDFQHASTNCRPTEKEAAVPTASRQPLKPHRSKVRKGDKTGQTGEARQAA